MACAKIVDLWTVRNSIDDGFERKLKSMRDMAYGGIPLVDNTDKHKT